jgi:glycerol-3-phosphate acyltransferase PlsY
MLEIVTKLVISYLLGSLMGGLVLGKLMGGADLRTVGSESAGATNALRTRGKGFAAGVFLIDILKGLAAVTLVAGLTWPGGGTSLLTPPALSAACGVAAVLGHLYPVFFGFRGGKGVATLLGAMLGLSPLILGVALLAWVAILLASGYVGLASIGAGLVAAATTLLWVPGTITAPITLFCLLMACLLIYTHRSNIQRLRNGTEHRFNVLGRFGK